MACEVNTEPGGSGRRTKVARGLSLLDGAARRTRASRAPSLRGGGRAVPNSARPGNKNLLNGELKTL
jgi:hypothetical protein